MKAGLLEWMFIAFQIPTPLANVPAGSILRET